MTSAITPSTQTPFSAQQLTDTASAAPGTTSPLSGAVPAQLPVRSYASATKTATQISSTPAGASTPSQNAKPASDTPVNGADAMAQGGPQAASAVPHGTPNHTDHGRKPSVVINASGASGYTPNGGPVGQNSRPAISFGSINSQGSPLPPASVPHQSQTSSLPTPQRDPRVISPAHSPSPIPQPPASGGRPPSSLQNQSNGMTFGSMGGEGEQMRQNQMQPSSQLGPGIPMHERRTSSQSLHSDPNMNRTFVPQNGRGRGYPPQQYGMPSPAPNYRQVPGGPPRPAPNMASQFQQQMAPNSPYSRGRNSPAIAHQQPNMPPQYMGGNSQGGYGGYGGHMGPQQYQQQAMYPSYDPTGGYYQPYWNQQAPPQSPRPPYPSPYAAPPSQMAPPFHPPSMSRSASQASERPASSMGQQQTPSMQQAQPSNQTSTPNHQPQTSQSSNFIRPKKASAALVIRDANGNPISFNKASPTPSASVQPQTPVIVSTPNAPTPPPRAPSGQHVRTESKSTKTAEETKNAFQEQVKRQMEEKRKNDEAEAAKAKQEKDESEAKAQKEREASEAAAKDTIKEATAEAEKAAAVDAGDEEGKEAAEAAVSAVAKDDEEKGPKEETEDERLEREIAEMEAEFEAREREEEERERIFQEKKNKEKAETAKKEAEAAAKADEELKRQEREAEEREEQREREREAEKAEKADEEPDEESRDMFASLKKPTLGPGAETPASGTETPASEEAESSPMPPPAQPATGSLARPLGAQKPKPAHLKLETAKRVEPAEPTPGMQALKSARFLTVKEEAKYPDGFKSPNPALNLNGARKGRAYDKEFLLQFQPVFKEKPSLEWDQKVKDTLGSGDEPGSARPNSARTPSTNMGRSASGRPGPQAMPNFGGPMGNFGNQPIRTLPPGTTSADRFAASQQGGRPMPPPMGGRVPSQFGMPQPVGMSRTNSLQTMANIGGPGSPRQPSARGGKGQGSRRGDRVMSKKEEAELAAKMPLTAHIEVAPLQKSTTGWKPTNIGGPMAAPQHDVSGNMAPDMVQRKVKAALNKMTPEKFERIAGQILEIAGQSKNESDGRTLRQVIQLTFEKACDEAHWAGMYAQFCSMMLRNMSADIRDETITDKNGQPVVGGALFRKYLLNRCQEEFERGWQVNLPDKPEGESQEAALLSDEYYIAAAAKRRGLGLIQFIGQLYKLKMLTLRIMHECVMKLLNFEGDPDEAAVENLTTLLRSVGATMEADDQGTKFIDAYFERIDSALLKNDALPSRPRFMIMDLVDLRKAHWVGKGDKGPKTIQQIHEEAQAAAASADAERARTQQRGGPQGGRMPQGRGDARNFSGGMPPPMPSNDVGLGDLRKLQQRGQSQRTAGTNLGPGGGFNSLLGARAGSRRGAANLGPGSSGNTTRTNTPPVEKEKKEEASSQNTFGALASLDPSGEAHDDAASHSEAASPPTRAKSPLATEKAEESSTT